MKSCVTAILAQYLGRANHSHPDEPAWPAPSPTLKLIVVIPCLAEHGYLETVLAALERGNRRLDEAEVLAVINHPQGAPTDVAQDNLDTLNALRRRPGSGLRILAMDCATGDRALPPRRAGVGMARRLGLDAALRRLASAGTAGRGALACLDADSPPDPGYLDLLLDCFDRDDAPMGAVCAYAHARPADPDLAAAAARYECWLRCHERALRAAGSMFAYPMIGSCLAASARGYALAGGMPELRAAEDFHFLRKLVKAGWNRPLARLRARVRPSARLSRRAPFGTGRALERSLAEASHPYDSFPDPEVFAEVRGFFQTLGGLRRGSALRPGDLPTRLGDFLDREQAWGVLARLRANYTDAPRFRTAAQHWFDSLRILRYAHARARAGAVLPLSEAASRLAAWFPGPDHFSALQEAPPGLYSG